MRRRPLFRQFSVVLACALAGQLLVSCSRSEDDGTKPRALAAELPALELRDETPNLLLTWIDGRGQAHVEVSTASVPAEGRDLVRVMIAESEHGTRDLFYVADLRERRDDGTYPVRTLPRREWEEILEKRREAHVAKLAPPAPPPAPPPAGSGPPSAPPPTPPAATGVMVVIYGADWCKPCHQAADYLKKKGVPHVVKDVEESRAAAEEMRDKLERSGNRGGSIPVIDVRGQILVGFNPKALDRAVARAASGTAL